MFVYLAGAIDAVGHDEARDWREEAREKLLLRFVGTFSPVHAFTAVTDMFSEQVCEGMIAINDTAVKRANAVLANLGGKSYGTPLEVELARSSSVPVIAFGVSPYSIYRHRFRVAGDLTDAINKTLEVLGRKALTPSDVSGNVS